MIFIKLILTNILLIVTILASAQCESFGWANFDGQNYAGAVSGGGNSSPIQVTTFSELKSAVESSEAKVIHVMNDMGNGYLGTTGDVLYIKSDKTIIGDHPGITIQCSWQIKNVSNIIVKNLIIRGPGNSNSQQNWDAVNIEGSKRIWFDHCTVMEGEDGNFDVVKGSDNVSVTWCKFTYVTGGEHNLSNLIGSSDNETISHGKLNVTYAYCWWDNVNSRCPRTRYGKIHVLNCYYNNVGSACYAGKMSNIRVEGCYFENNVSNPTGLISTGGEAGVFAINCNRGSTQTDGYNSPFTPPYEYNAFQNSEVRDLVTNTDCGAGPTLDSPTDCCGGTLNATLTLTSGESEQIVETGTSIEDIVYTWGGSATDVNISGLPDGLSTNKSGNTITIYGTPASSGSYTISTVQSEGEGQTLTGNIAITILPVIQITSPVDNFETVSPASITISADASDPDGSVSSVDFYNGNDLINSDNSAPYTYNWTNVPSGNYIIRAVATDNQGASTTDQISVLVSRGSNEPITIQAETACEVATGNPSENLNAEYNGTGYVNLDNEADTYFRINVYATEDIASTDMIVRYTATNNRNMSVTVNGITQVNEIQLPGTGSWTSWTDATATISLNEGINTIVFTSLVSDGGPNIDQITFNSGNVYSTTNCEDNPASLTLVSGSANQEIIAGASIEPIEYTIGGSATGYSIIGLPNGVTASENGSTITISGIPAESFSYTITTTGGTSSVTKNGYIAITSEPVHISLHAGWNLIGYPFTTEQETSSALSSIWENVLLIKNQNAFYDRSQADFLNLLTTLQWGKGYLIKVNEDCELIWIVP